MASAAQAASSSGLFMVSSSQSILLATRRNSLSLSPLGLRVYHQFSARPLLQFNQRPLFPIVSQVAVDSKSNSAPVGASELETKAEEEILEESTNPINETTLSAVMADVTNLIKLVDTRDIVELELKHHDYELIIRKKEALTSPAVAPSLLPPRMDQPPYSAYPVPPVTPTPAAASAPPVPASIPVPASPASAPAANLPCILSPMAGTFYKCPAPGEPPFVKVGDKITKGQVICIVEAMKLMNDIEADQTGTIVEVIAEHGKPVSVDTPLFSIKP